MFQFDPSLEFIDLYRPRVEVIDMNKLANLFIDVKSVMMKQHYLLKRDVSSERLWVLIPSLQDAHRILSVGNNIFERDAEIK